MSNIKRRRMFFGLLETHFSAPLFAVALLAAIWLGTVHTINSEKAGLEQEAVNATLALGEVYEAQMIRNLGFIDQTLKTVKYAYERNPSPAVLTELDSKGLLPPRLVFGISIVGADEKIVASNFTDKSPRVARHCAHYDDHPVNDDMHMDFMPGKGERASFVRFSRCLFSGGRYLGVVSVTVAPGYFVSGYESKQFGREGLLALLAGDGRFIVRRSGDQMSVGENAGFFEGSAKSREHVSLLTSASDGVERYTNVRRLYGYPLSIALGLSKKERLAAFYEKRQQHFLMAGVASVLLAIGTVLLVWMSWQLAQSRRRIRKKQQTYYAASEASLDAMFVLRAETGGGAEIRDFVLESVNQRGANLFGVGKEEISDMRLTHMLPQCRTNGIFDDLVNVYQTGQLSETEWLSDMAVMNGRWLYRQVVSVEDGVVVIMRDITERKKEEARMAHLATHDVLTGLPNRALLYEKVEEAILHAQVNQRMAAVVFVDLDHFKEVNDTHGHKIGDELLKVVSARIQNCLRQSDTVSRLGGDEFVVVLADQGDLDGMILPTVERVRAVVAEPVFIGGLKLNVTPSIGLAVYPEHGEDSDTLLSHADMAMYDAKSRGRNKLSVYSDMEMTSVG